MEKEICKIYKNGKICYYVAETNRYEIFGWIDDLGIKFNIQKNVYTTIYGQTIDETIPNPPIEFYIELGKQLNKEIRDKRNRGSKNK